MCSCLERKWQNISSASWECFLLIVNLHQGGGGYYCVLSGWNNGKYHNFSFTWHSANLSPWNLQLSVCFRGGPSSRLSVLCSKLTWSVDELSTWVFREVAQIQSSSLQPEPHVWWRYRHQVKLLFKVPISSVNSGGRMNQSSCGRKQTCPGCYFPSPHPHLPCINMNVYKEAKKKKKNGINDWDFSDN